MMENNNSTKKSATLTIIQYLKDIEAKLDLLLEIANKNTDTYKSVDYSAEELYDLKKKMSWSTLHTYTGIPLSTLQYRVRKYKELNKLKDDDEIII